MPLYDSIHVHTPPPPGKGTVETLRVLFTGRVDRNRASGVAVKIYEGADDPGLNYVLVIEMSEEGKAIRRGIEIPMADVEALRDALSYVLAGPLGKRALLQE